MGLLATGKARARTGARCHRPGEVHSPWYGTILPAHHDVRRIQRHPADPRTGDKLRLAALVALLAVAALAVLK